MTREAPTTTAPEDLGGLERRFEAFVASDLPDFAPEKFTALQATFNRLRSRASLDRSPPDLREAQAQLKETEVLANGTKRLLGKAYELRNASLHANFVRASDPSAIDRAEATFAEALKRANEGNQTEARRLSVVAASQYQDVIKGAKARATKVLSAPLQVVATSVASDARILGSTEITGGALTQIDGVAARFARNPRLDARPEDLDTWVLDPNDPYYPSVPAGPNPASGLMVDQRETTSLRLKWADVSDNETGSRLLRTLDFSTWTTISEIGILPKFAGGEFVDRDLEPDTRYCYVLETYNVEGARRSQFACGATRDGRSINIWRLQLRVKMATSSGAGLDNPLRVYVGDVETFLDYGHDDFERGSEFVYDLNIGTIKELSDITGLTIGNVFDNDDPNDTGLIESFRLMVNNGREIYGRNFGATSSSALPLAAGGIPLQVGHAELRASPIWQAYVTASTNTTIDTYNLPPIEPGEDGKFQVRIPAAEVVSRIESYVGHALNTDDAIRGRIVWGYLDGPAVEVSRTGQKSLHVDLDLEAKIDYWPNPSLDVDFDVSVSKSCDDGKFVVTVALTNATSNADYSLWKDIASHGLLKATDELIDWYAANCENFPSIDRSVAMNPPAASVCADMDVHVDADGSIVISGIVLLP